jgi:hypothetical protein
MLVRHGITVVEASPFVPLEQVLRGGRVAA